MQNTFAHESGYFGLHDSTRALKAPFRNFNPFRFPSTWSIWIVLTTLRSASHRFFCALTDRFAFPQQMHELQHVRVSTVYLPLVVARTGELFCRRGVWRLQLRAAPYDAKPISDRRIYG
jgi:hypothetical protein